MRDGAQVDAVFEAITQRWGRLDILFHAIAFAPKEALQGRVVDCPRDGFLTAMDVSCWSLLDLARRAEPLMKEGGTVLTMSYLGANEVVENYGIMGPVMRSWRARPRRRSRAGSRSWSVARRSWSPSLPGQGHPAPRLHPNLAKLYRARVAELSRVLAAEDGAEEREVVRGLVEAIRLVPEDGRLRIEVRGGERGAILRLAEGARGGRNAERPGSDAEAFVSQIKMDAGTRNRRYQYITVAI